MGNVKRFLKAVLLLLLACQLNAGVYAADKAGIAPVELDAFSLSPVFEITAEHLQAQGAVIPVPQYAAQSRGQSVTLPYCAFSSQDISNLVVSAIEGSDRSIDVALYGLTLQNVTLALLRAKNRGIRVRIIMNERHMYPRRSEQIQFLLDNGIEMRTIHGFSNYGIMHNKFGVFDSAFIQTGSFNWTHTSNTRNYENVNFIDYPKTVNGYRQYWDWMWSYSQPIVDDASYRAQAQPVPPCDPNPSVKFNGTTFPVYSFSPQGGSKDWIMKAIDSSRKSIRVAVFSFYAKYMADALLKAKARGVDVRIVVDRAQGKSSPLTEYILDNGLDLRWSPGPGGKGMMHHKFAVFDGKLLENGSHNWSSNAEYNNFENVFYTTRSQYVSAYINEFEKIYASAQVPTPEEVSSSGGFFKNGENGDTTLFFPDDTGDQTVVDFTDDPSYDLEYSE